MPRKWAVDGDHSDRLPAGVKQVGYDADTGVRYYTVEGDERIHEGKPGAVYSPITPVGPPLSSQQSRSPVTTGPSRSSSVTYTSRPSTSGSTGGSTLVPSPSSSQADLNYLNRSNTDSGYRVQRKPIRVGTMPSQATAGPSSSRQRQTSSGVSRDESHGSDSENERKKPIASLGRSVSKSLKRVFTAPSGPQPSSHITFSSTSTRPERAASSRRQTTAASPVPVPTTFDAILANEEVRQGGDRKQKQPERNNDRAPNYQKILRRTTWSQ
ncbi:hypothetical protein QBC35DRAFT_209034 [Podospora australis]|uniref:Uncharacterized protein n=1 Tax=Podospora australis TaxID=1536484 RepID=A0AAN6WHY2_9PEZI|nr:hypothetical protein QBC35DRAFT_209034 [Podospora australis]